MQVINANFNGFPLCSVTFTLAQGTQPGSGTITFAEYNAAIGNFGTLYISDGERSISINKVYIGNARWENTAEGGRSYVATIYDRRVTWKWGYVCGLYNELDASGVPKKEVKLIDLIKKCFDAVYEKDYLLENIPDIYPEVDWDCESPDVALASLLERHNLCLGIDTSISGGTFVVCDKNRSAVIPKTMGVEEFMESNENPILPISVILVGGKKIVQKTFTGLVPVGEDTDGSIRPINDLSYKPTGAGGGGESYTYEKWGQELVACFANISDAHSRELAEKSVFKWYSINWENEDVDLVLPLLSEIADTVVVEGVEEHDKPYALGTKVVWDGTTFKTISSAKIEDGYTVDRKIGVVQFNEPQIRIVNSDGPVSGGVKEALLDLVAAYEVNEGKITDYITYYRMINGGVSLPATYKDSSLIGYYKIVNGVLVLQKQADVDLYANALLNQIAKTYVNYYPKSIRYPGVWANGAVGEARNAIIEMDAESGCSTIMQYGYEIPKIGDIKYREKLEKRIATIDFQNKAPTTNGAIRTAAKQVNRENIRRSQGVASNRGQFSIWGKSSGDVVKVKNVYGSDIPVKSLIEISSYNTTDKVLEVTRASSDGAKSIAFTQEGIPSGKIGFAHLGGVRIVLADSGYTSPAAGDVVAVKGSTFKVALNPNGNLQVVKVSGSDIYVKPIGGGGGSGTALKLFRVVSGSGNNGNYHCYEQYLNNSDWQYEDNHAYSDLNTTTVHVWNICENGLTGQALSTNDLLVAWEVADSYGTKWWIGFPPRYAWWHA